MDVVKNSSIICISVILLLCCWPASAGQSLPAGSGLDFALAYYQQHVLSGEKCPATVGINARNKSAILAAAMSGYASATEQTGRAAELANYFAAIAQSGKRCGSKLLVLPDTISNEVSRLLMPSGQTSEQITCPVLEASEMEVFERYLEALAAKVMWDTLAKRC